MTDHTEEQLALMKNSAPENHVSLRGFSIYAKFLGIFAVTAFVVTGAYLLIGIQFNNLQYKREASAVSKQVTSFIHWVSENEYIYVKDSKSAHHKNVSSKDFKKSDEIFKLYAKDMSQSSKELANIYLSVSHGTKFRLSSDRYFNAENKPDTFEKEAIEFFKTQKDKPDDDLYYEKQTEKTYKYAKPLYIIESCLDCHGSFEKVPSDIQKKYKNKKAFDYKVGDLRGIVTVDIPRRDYLELLKTFFSDVFLASILLFSVTLINFIWFRKIISKPLRKLTEYADELSRRNLKAEVNIQSNDELGLLADTMQFMADDIGMHIKSIEDSKQKIENYALNLEGMNKTFSQFVPQEFLSYLGHKDITKIELGDQVQKEMSILFSDIRDFTKLSESMTPEENFNFLNHYLNDLGPIINDNGGFIDKYIGDAIMALFPLKPEDAVKSAVEIQIQLSNFNEIRKSNGLSEVNTGIGIHFGSLMLGTIGYQHHMQTTVISDAVNLASRIEGLTKFFQAKILVSEFLLENIPDKSLFKSRFLGKFHLKGKADQVPVYEIYDADPAEVIELKDKTLKDFEYAVYVYRNKNFKKAHELFLKVAEINPHDLQTKVYIEQTEKHIEIENIL